MTTDHTPPAAQAVDRIPLAHTVHYVARGLPEVPNQYGAGVLAPSEITLTYRAAPDSQLGRVHAYVAGRLWVDGVEIPLLSGGLYGQHYDGSDVWPDWLTEEARLHDPEAAAVEPAADRASLAAGLRAAADEIAGIDFHPNARARSLDIAGGLARRLRRMADEAQPDEGAHEHVWVTALDGDDQPARDEAGRTWTHCGVCGTPQDEAQP